MKTIIERLRPRIGPGLIVALVVTGIVLWHNWRWQHSPKPLIVEHQTVSETGPVGVPDPPFVLVRADALKLSATQCEQVRKLTEEYTHTQEPLLAAASAATAEAVVKLDQLKASGKRAKLEATSSEAQGISDASRRLSDLRVGTWPQLAAVLTEGQAQKAKAAWAEAHTLVTGAANTGGG